MILKLGLLTEQTLVMILHYMIQVVQVMQKHMHNMNMTKTVPLMHYMIQDCRGYATAYFNQQCDISALYDSACPGIMGLILGNVV